MLNRNETNIPITATDKTGRAFASARNNLKMLGSDGAKVTRALTGLFGAAGIGYTASALLRSIADVNKEFESASKEVNSLLNLGHDGFRDLQNDIRRVSASIGTDLVTNTKAAYQAISAGVDRENLAGFLRTANEAAIAGLSDTETAVNLLTSVLNAYRGSNVDAAKAADILFAAVKDGKTTFGELAEAMYIAAPVAAAAGVSFEELAAAAATITTVTNNTGVAMTQIKGAITAVLKPTADMEKIFEKLGVSSGEALLKTRGLGGAMHDIRSAADSSGISLTRAFGRLEGYNAMLNITGDSAMAFQKNYSHAMNSAGESAKAFAENNDTAARSLEKVASAWQNAATSFQNTSAVKGFNSILASTLNDAAAFFGDQADKIKHDIDVINAAMEDGAKWYVVGEAQSHITEAARKGWIDAKTSVVDYQGAVDQLRALLESMGDSDELFADQSKALDGVAESAKGVADAIGSIEPVKILADDDTKLKQLGDLVRQLSEARATPDQLIGVYTSEITSMHVELRRLEDQGLANTAEWADLYIAALQTALKLEALQEAQIRKNNAARADSIKLLDEMAKQGRLSLDDVFAAMEDSQQTDPLREWRESGMDSIELITTAMKDASRNMTDSFMQFVESGKFSFDDLVSSILNDIARLTFQQSVATPIAQMLSAGLAGAFGGARASGGPVSAGTSYLVGERGPELFVPKRGGTIVPNGAPVVAAGDTISVVIEINTIDSASFSSRLHEHKRQITAAVDEALNKRGRRGVSQ